MGTDRVREEVLGLGRPGTPGRLERALWLAVALALVGDVVTTLLGLHLGLVESNPVARGAIEVAGPVAMVAMKAGAIGVGLACRPLLPAPYAPIVPACLAGPWLCATAYNLSVLVVVI
ncbi:MULTISPECIES: DUF5658 family protein [Saliphagus]|uniref:DUF5658 family protein n=1 Tax=Saliphagus infecundisoli TaxID=1849069 RepID=A0ABD5QC77_9EURY|nr:MULTISPECIES: DUF5658 family protein [Saliphagus]